MSAAASSAAGTGSSGNAGFRKRLEREAEWNGLFPAKELVVVSGRRAPPPCAEPGTPAHSRGRRAEGNKRMVTLVDSSCQPKKAELAEPIRIPEGTTPELARVIMRPVEIRWKPRSD